MFEHMEISETIYEGVVEPSYIFKNRAHDERAGQNK